MGSSLTDQNGNNIGKLNNYTLNLSSVPLDPRDTSTQLPNWTAALSDLDVAPRSLSGKKVTLTDWTGNPSNSRVSAVNSTSFSQTSVDGATLFERLNASQTVHPLVNTTVEDVLLHWCVMSGVPTYQLPDRLLYCYDAGRSRNQRYGYIADAPTDRLSVNATGLGWDQTQTASTGSSVAYLDRTGAGNVGAPLYIDAVRSVLFSAQFANAYTDSYAEAVFMIPTAGQGFKLSSGGTTRTYWEGALWIQRNGNVWTVYTDLAQGATDNIKTILTANYALQGNSKSNPFVFLLCSANAQDPSKVDFTLRIIEDGSTLTPASVQSAVTDFTVKGVSTWLSQYPQIFQIKLAYPRASDLNWAAYGLPVPAGTSPGPANLAGISESSTLPTSYPTRQLRFGSASNDTTALNGGSPCANIPGFTENVWDQMRMFCSVYNIDIAYLNGAIVFTDRGNAQTDPTTGAFIPAYPVQKGVLSERLQNRDRARRVEVVWNKPGPNYTSAADCNQILLYKADTVQTLDQGEYKEIVVQAGLPAKGAAEKANPVTATFASLNQPSPVTGEPVPYTNSTGSTYTVWGADGYNVPPQWWIDNGGSITVEATDKAGEIKIKMQAPSVTTTRAPYRLSEGTGDHPALYITGSGLPVTEQKLQTFTGDPTAAADIGHSLKAPWITDSLTAYNAAFKLAQYFSGATSSVTFQVNKTAMEIESTTTAGSTTLTPYAPVEGMNASGATPYEPVPMNQSFSHDGSYFRTKNVAVTPGGFNVTESEMNNTIAVINGEYAASMTIAQWNSMHGQKTIGDFYLTPLISDPALYPSPSLYPSPTQFTRGGK